MAGVLPTVAQSPQFLAITRHSSDLCRGITRLWTITSFAQSLEQECLITPDATRSILHTPGVSDEDKCVRLLDAVKEQVRIDPAKFETLIGIFRREPALILYADTVCAIRGEHYNRYRCMESIGSAAIQNWCQDVIECCSFQLRSPYLCLRYMVMFTHACMQVKPNLVLSLYESRCWSQKRYP